MKARKLRALLGEGRSRVDEGRLEDRSERVMRGENAEMGLGRVGGIGGRSGERKMGRGESGAGRSLAITTHFTRLLKRRELVRRAKTKGLHLMRIQCASESCRGDRRFTADENKMGQRKSGPVRRAKTNGCPEKRKRTGTATGGKRLNPCGSSRIAENVKTPGTFVAEKVSNYRIRRFFLFIWFRICRHILPLW